jgi:hypothetical protein
MICKYINIVCFCVYVGDCITQFEESAKYFSDIKANSGLNSLESLCRSIWNCFKLFKNQAAAIIRYFKRWVLGLFLRKHTSSALRKSQVMMFMQISTTCSGNQTSQAYSGCEMYCVMLKHGAHTVITSLYISNTKAICLSI